jgi:hemoglobin
MRTLLAPLFATMPKEHFQHVADFIAEVLGGPKEYSAEHGGHAAMVRHHLGKGITEQQRHRWVSLLLETADELNLPSDPEFRSALVAYLEWGSRLAVLNSALPASTAVDEGTPMPEWNWGVPGGPYQSANPK